MLSESDLVLEKILPTDNQIQTLYELLAHRGRGISHNTMPSFQDHEAFVLNHPYREWLLVRFDGKTIGSVYIQNDNSVGININDTYVTSCFKYIIDYIKKNYNPLPPIKSVRASNFIINIAPSASTLIELLKENNNKLLQLTYEL